MKRNFTFLLGLAIAATLQFLTVQTSNAQGTQNDNFTLEIKTASSSRYFAKGDCGWGYSLFGPNIAEEMCGEVVWGYDVDGDSLVCQAVTNDYTGKIVLIRRGVCNFSEKVFNAQKAGAKAVIVANHFATATDNGCSIFGMSAGINADSVTIPAIFLCRDAADYLDQQIKAGATQACFLFPRILDPYAAYHYATPVSQIIPLGNLGFNFINRETDTISDMTISAQIKEPSGNVTLLESAVPPIAPGLDTLLFFDAYTPPAETGDFEVTIYTNKYDEGRDTLHRKFTQTEYTFANDNLNLMLDGGAALDSPQFQVDLQYRAGNLIFTGDNGGVATHFTFGIAEVGRVYVPGNDAANTLVIYLFDGDADDNGRLDLQSSFLDMELVGSGSYIMNGTETESGLIHVELSDVNSGTPGVELLPNHNYYAVIEYDGTENGSGLMIPFTNTSYEPYLFFVNEAGSGVPSSPIWLGGALSYWSDRNIVTRLQLEGFDPTISVKPSFLDPTQYAVSPNPANEQVRLDLNLENPGSDVYVTIASALGQVVSRQTLKNFQNGTVVTMDVKSVPSGNYFMTIRTNEGVGIKKVAICH